MLMMAGIEKERMSFGMLAVPRVEILLFNMIPLGFLKFALALNRF